MSGDRFARIALTNETEGYRFSDFEELLAETWMGEGATTGELFRAYQAEYGRCTSKVYVDRPDSPPRPIGWFFVSRQRYEDTNEPYLQGAWVTIHELF